MSSSYAGVESHSDEVGSREHNGSNGSSQSTTSFSHVFASVSKGSDDNAATTSAKTARQTRDEDNNTGNEDASASTATQPPVQQPPLTIAGILGFLGHEQPIAKPASEAEGAADESTGGTAQTESSIGSKAQPNLAVSSGVLQTLMPVLGMVKGSPKTAESKTPSDKHSGQVPAATYMFPANFDRVPGEALDTDANAEGASGAAAGPANGAATGQAGNTAVGNATAANGATATKASAPLAFSMLITPEEGNTAAATSEAPSGPAEQAAVSTDVQHLSSAIGASASVQAGAALTEHPSEIQPNAPAVALAPAENARTSEDRVAPLEQSGTVKGAALDSGADTARNEAVRNVRLQLEGDNNQRVDVRLSDQGGELRVSVRSADANLTQALQDRMPELTSRLEQQHFRAEVWVPRPAETTNSSASNARSFHSPNGDSSGQDHSGRRQNGRQNNQPDGLDEDVPPQTGFKEITNQIWLQ